MAREMTSTDETLRRGIRTEMVGRGRKVFLDDGRTDKAIRPRDLGTSLLYDLSPIGRIAPIGSVPSNASIPAEFNVFRRVSFR